MSVGASFVYLLCVCGVFVRSFVGLACWLIFLLFARLRPWFGGFVVVLLFALVVVYMCGRLAVWWLVLLVSKWVCVLASLFVEWCVCAGLVSLCSTSPPAETRLTVYRRLSVKTTDMSQTSFFQIESRR